MEKADVIVVGGGIALARGISRMPCAAFPGTDGRASSPLAEGVVLIGDAAG